MYKNKYISINMCIYIYTYIHTYIHTYIPGMCMRRVVRRDAHVDAATQTPKVRNPEIMLEPRTPYSSLKNHVVVLETTNPKPDCGVADRTNL